MVVVCPPEGPLADHFGQLPVVACHPEKMGTHTARIRGVVGSLALTNPCARGRYRQILKRMQSEHNCDTVLFQYPREQALATEIAASMGYRVVWIIHSKLHYLANRIVVNPMLRRSIQRANPAFVISGATKRALINEGFPARQMKGLQVGVDIPPNGAAIRRIGPLRVGVVCRLVRLKGVQDILQAAALIAQQTTCVEFLVAGDGRYKTELEEMARRLGISGIVRFLGFVQDPLEVYKQLDVLAHATFDPGESMPTSILEAAAMAVPSVATRWAGIPEIVQDGETGILVPPHDANAIRNALLRLLNDRALLSRLGENGRSFVASHFSMEAVARTFLHEFGDPLAGPHFVQPETIQLKNSGGA